MSLVEVKVPAVGESVQRDDLGGTKMMVTMLNLMMSL